MENHKPILGLIHLPLTGETFYGYEGTAKKHVAGHSAPLQTRPLPPAGATLLLSTHDMKSKEKWEACLKGTPVDKVEPPFTARSNSAGLPKARQTFTCALFPARSGTRPQVKSSLKPQEAAWKPLTGRPLSMASPTLKMQGLRFPVKNHDRLSHARGP